MPVTLELRENDRVLYYTFIDTWEVSELTALYPQSMAYLHNASRKLYTLAVFPCRARPIPSGLLTLRYGPDWSHPNGGQIAVVGASALLRTFANFTFRLRGFEKTRFFDTEEEAWNHLRKLIADEAEIPTE